MTEQTVNIQLATNIIYVSGTVNGVDTVFTLTEEPGLWTARAAKNPLGRYDVSISAYSAQGLAATVDRTLWYLEGWIEPVTDRTAQDVAAGTEKGFYNIGDLNRVGSDVRWLTEQLQACGYLAATSPRSDWTIEEFPTETAMARYLANVANLRQVFPALPDTPALPETMANLDWRKANAIEQNLTDLKQVFEWTQACYKRSGAFYTGEGSVILPT